MALAKGNGAAGTDAHLATVSRWQPLCNPPIGHARLEDSFLDALQFGG